MRRSTKITIGVIVFILICLIVGLTLYFVLRKKDSSTSIPSSSPSVSPSINNKDLTTFLGVLKNAVPNFRKEEDNNYSNFQEALQSGSVDKIEKAFKIYNLFYLSVGQFKNDSRNKINSILHNNGYSSNHIIVFEKLSNTIEMETIEASNIVKEIPDSKPKEKVEAMRSAINLYINHLIKLFEVGRTF